MLGGFKFNLLLKGRSAMKSHHTDLSFMHCGVESPSRMNTAQALLATCNLLNCLTVHRLFLIFSLKFLLQFVFHEPRFLLRDEKLFYTTWKKSENETQTYQRQHLSSYYITIMAAAGKGFYCLRFQSHKGCKFVQ